MNRAIHLIIPLILLASGPALAKEIVISFGGDVCLNRNRLLPRSDGTGSGSAVTPWSKLTKHIAPLLKGSDLAFGNLETVVTDRKDLNPEGKAYAFQSHVAGVEHLADIGFNLFSLANNHAYDFGAAGARETLKHMAALKKRGVRSAGLGHDIAEAVRPELFKIKGKTIAFSAVGIITNMNRAHRVGAKKPGTVRYRDDKDYSLVLKELGKVKADYKILSIHFGTERRYTLDRGQRKRFRRALKEAGVDLVLGHHAHVVRGVERDGAKVVFYGLGNYLIRGARNMGPLPDPQDYGLFGKLYLNVNKDTGKLEAQASEVVPLTGMHYVARPMSPESARRRLEVLNGLSQKAVGVDALTFDIRDNGTGVACFGAHPGPAARALCGP